MSEYSYDTWNGLTFGFNGSQTYGLIRTVGLDGREFTTGRLGGGFDGGADVASFAQAQGWTTELDLTAADGAGWQSLRDGLRAATASPDVGEYVIHHRDDVWTVFAKVASRDIPRDAAAMERTNGVATVTFEAVDPVQYGPTATIDFTGSSDSDTFESPGWVDSYRLKWVVPGPVTNPQISSSIDPSAVIRYVGTIPSGSNLVVELFPRGSVPGYYAKIVDDADLANYATTGIGDPAYGQLDGGASGSARPPQWFPIPGGTQTISYSATAGTAGSTFTWRPGHG